MPIKSDTQSFKLIFKYFLYYYILIFIEVSQVESSFQFFF